MIIVKRFGAYNYNVYLNKKQVGNIKFVTSPKKGWAYQPKNSDKMGEIFKRWQECKESLY